MSKKGDRHQRAWKESKRAGVNECFWCERPFTLLQPPSIDHIEPKSSGGTIRHGIVFACQSCNSKRGNIPYDDYLEAVELERAMALREDRPYRRPTRRVVNGEWVVTTLTRAQIKMVEQMAETIDEPLDFLLDPEDVVKDKRWEREGA